jgi:hypothetical protein
MIHVGGKKGTVIKKYSLIKSPLKSIIRLLYCKINVFLGADAD